MNMLSSFTHPHWFSKSVWPSFLRGYSEKWLFFLFVQWYSVWFNVAWIPVFLCVFHKKETYTGLKQHENVKMTSAFSFFKETIPCFEQKIKKLLLQFKQKMRFCKGLICCYPKKRNQQNNSMHTYIWILNTTTFNFAPFQTGTGPYKGPIHRREYLT